jgi:hypothetical protein
MGHRLSTYPTLGHPWTTFTKRSRLRNGSIGQWGSRMARFIFHEGDGMLWAIL